ncbi:MAG: preprotein translocase subunit SecG, partial [Filomicrobium sp.]
MENVLLVVHVLIVLALIVSVLMQRSEGGALGMGGGGSGGGGFLTGRGTANMLTRTTAILAVCFFVTSIVSTILANR